MSITITEVNARTYARLGQAGSIFGIGLFDAIDSVGTPFVLTADMGKPAGMNRFRTRFQEYFINLGIAEQNLIGVAAGLASEGHPVVASAQAVFISMRSFEQIRQYMGYMGLPIVIVGISAGFGLTFFGNTHYAIEDIGILRTIPGMTIISPSDCSQAAKAISAALKSKQPTYIRCTGILNSPIIYKNDYEYHIGKSIEIKPGSDIAIFTTGTVTSNAIEASQFLEEKGISTAVIDMHTIKPLDVAILHKFLKHKLLVSIEEHNIIGGLGGAISENLSNLTNRPRLLRLGIKDSFFNPGDYNHLLNQSRLDAKSITEDIFKEFA